VAPGVGEELEKTYCGLAMIVLEKIIESGRI
jgi:hypothetical protein